MNWMQFLGILGTLLGSVVFMYRELKEWRQEMKNDMASFERKNEIQDARTDKLYEMFCEQQTNFDQKFYDLLKEKK